MLPQTSRVDLRAATSLFGCALAVSACHPAADGVADDTGAAVERPWPTVSTIDPRGEMDCTDYGTPCNHQFYLLVGAGDEWELLPGPFAIYASVPDPTLVTHGVIDGELWYELRIVYVDVLPENMTDGHTQWLAMASLAFPESALADPGPVALFSGESEWQWVFVAPTLEDPDILPVDPNLETFVDDDGSLVWLIVASEDRPPDSEVNSPGDVIMARSTDGVRFGELERFGPTADSAVQGSDPDPFPIADLDRYPATLPIALAPWNGGRWGLHMSLPKLKLFLHDDEAWGEGVSVSADASVSTTSIEDGQTWVYAGRMLEVEDQLYPQIIRFAFSEDGDYGEPEDVMDGRVADALKAGPGAPAYVPLPEPAAGVGLMVAAIPVWSGDSVVTPD